MDKTNAKNSTWARQARGGNLAQRQVQETQEVSCDDGYRQDVERKLFRDDSDESCELYSLLMRTGQSSQELCVFLSTPLEALGGRKPGDVILEGDYSAVITALQ